MTGFEDELLTGCCFVNSALYCIFHIYYSNIKNAAAALRFMYKDHLLQNMFCLLSILQSLVLQSEQYPPVASQMLKNLKTKIKIIANVRRSTDSS